MHLALEQTFHPRPWLSWVFLAFPIFRLQPQFNLSGPRLAHKVWTKYSPPTAFCATQKSESKGAAVGWHHDRHSEEHPHEFSGWRKCLLSFGSCSCHLLTMPGRHEKARAAAWEARHQGTRLEFQEPVYQHQRTCKILQVVEVV